MSERYMTWPEYVRHTIGDDKQREVAAKTGIDQGTISRWLRAGPGDKLSFSTASVRAFARGYGLPVLEAFMVAGFLTTEDVDIPRPVSHVWDHVSDEELAAEVRRRLVRSKMQPVIAL